MSPQLPCLQGVKQWQTMFALTSGQRKPHKFVQCYSGVNIEYKTETQLMCVSSPAAAILRYILCSFVEYIKRGSWPKNCLPFCGLQLSLVK